MRHQLTASIAARQKRADNRAFFFNRARREHHKHECHNRDDDIQQRRPHRRVARHVVFGIPNALVRIDVGQIGHVRMGVGKCAHHVFFDIHTIGHRKVAIVKAVRVGIAWQKARILERLEALGRHFGHAKRKRIHREIGVALEKSLIVGQRHNANHAKLDAVERDRIAYGYIVVRCEHAVNGDFVCRLGLAALRIRGQIDLRAMLERAHRAVAGVIALRFLEARIEGIVLVQLNATRIGRSITHGIELLIGRLERRGEAAVFNAVGFGHIVDDDRNGMGGEQKSRGKRDAHGHEQKYAEVFSNIVDKLARKPFDQGTHDDLPNKLCGGHGSGIRLVFNEHTVAKAQNAVRHVRDGVIVGHNDDGAAIIAIYLLHKGENFLRRFVVERACGLVAQKQARVFHERASDGTTLLLAARNLPGEFRAMLIEAQ